ncbi:ABC transporter substrate-binding protein [Ramlibacter sp. RBP-2]|uniref:ABC transporter substrate-binding protein n=1 Tax=Ramlibacter lithotrophicus TaxID=2606681 RepID=A0A7X6DE57_9BURK|nr:ABC transporter substrate-binding protein [Ramlibacter lithotrophicus]NKE65509.1 ABC transporter substrate-binding protein [Ramlibacter lithotrophicus]
MTSTRVRSLGLLGSALLALPALAADPILIGASITQSPPGSVVQGTQVKDGMEILKDMINAKGGVLGRQIQVLYEDNQGIPEKGRAATEKLITSNKVVALAGGHQSSVCLAEIEVAHRYKTPYVNTNCWSDDVRKRGYPEVFNTSPYNTLVSSSMAETLATMKVKRVVAFAENTDYGIGQAKLTGELLKQKAPNVEYKYETLDRASKDFTAAILPLRANPPDVVVLTMLPPAAYLVMNQMYEQGVAPSPKTLMYDGGGLADYPDFWQNVKEGGRYLLSFALYHPQMPQTQLAKDIAAEYKKRTGGDINRLVLQAADSLHLVVEGIKAAKSTDPEKLAQAMRTMKFDSLRGIGNFSTKPGYSFQQWLDIPYVNYELTAIKQPVGQTVLIQAPGQKFDAARIVRPAK